MSGVVRLNERASGKVKLFFSRRTVDFNAFREVINELPICIAFS